MVLTRAGAGRSSPPPNHQSPPPGSTNPAQGSSSSFLRPSTLNPLDPLTPDPALMRKVRFQFRVVEQVIASLTEALPHDRVHLLSAFQEKLSTELTKLGALVEQLDDAAAHEEHEDLQLRAMTLEVRVRARTAELSLASRRVDDTQDRSILSSSQQEPVLDVSSTSQRGATGDIPTPSDNVPQVPLPTVSGASPQPALTAASQSASDWSLLHALPKLSMDPFDGDPIQWPDWKRKFDFLVNQLAISNNQKMAYLQSFVTGRAREAIRHYSCNGALYTDALNTLQRKFGHPATIVHHYLDKLQQLRPLTTNKPETYIDFASFLNGLVSTFQDLGFHEDLGSTSNLRAVTAKLPYGEHLRWQQFVIDRQITRPDLPAFNDWFQSKARAYESLQLRPPPPIASGRNPYNQQLSTNLRSPHQQLNSHATQGPTGPPRPQGGSRDCPLRDGQHPLFACPAFKAKSVAERRSVVKTNGICFNCLQAGHMAKDCPRQGRCTIQGCNARHNTMLHDPAEANPHFATLAQHQHDTIQNHPHHNSAPRHGFANTSPSTDIMLQVLPVVLYNGRISIETYALLDSGSDFSILLEESASKLKLTTRSTQPITLSGINRTAQIKTSFADLEIAPLDRSKKFPLRNVNILADANMPKIRHHPGDVVHQYPHLESIHIASLHQAKVTLLLGLDVVGLMWPEETVKGPPGTPYASRCALGWSLCGPHIKSPFPRSQHSLLCQTCVRHDTELSQQVETWYQMEELGQKRKLQSADNTKAMEILDSTYTREPDGRIQLGMLWNTDKPLPNNRPIAERHLNWTVQRMHQDEATFSKYNEGINTDLEKGFIRELPYLDHKDEGWLIPHHGVTNPNKPGKIRRVLNAASVYQGVSLNDCLFTGPDLIGDLLGILVRFRENPVAVMADVEAMFMQVSVRPSDRKFLRFLWKTGPAEPVKLLEYVRHIFGKKDSPVVACYALHRAIKDFTSEHPELTDLAKDQFYMDDFSDSMRDDKEASSRALALVKVLARSHFNLTKWASNSPAFLETLPSTSLAKPIEQLMSVDNVERVLGAFWHLQTDTLMFKVPARLTLAPRITQRALLSFVSSMFDPLGLAAPLIIGIKTLLQDIWKDGQEWDKPVAEDKATRVRAWVDNLEALPPLRVPRQYMPQPTHQDAEIELHIFADASLDATAVVAYFRYLVPGGKPTTAFVLGKTRVAPIKQQTVPKLELQAAVYAVRMRKSILEKSRLTISRVRHWTDSASVLHWIRNPNERHKMFIANRLGEILDDSRRGEWFHVPGVDNPADDGTRGLPADAMDSNCRWLRGPAFLRGDADWPPDNFKGAEHCTLSVKRTASQNSSIEIDVNRFSTWSRLVGAVTAVLKATHIMRKVDTTPRQLRRRATHLLFGASVRASFPKELENLQSGHHVSGKSRIINFSPYLDQEGQLRSASRLRKAPVSRAITNPIILDARERIVRLFLEHQHRMQNHVGVEQMRNEIQQHYWIVGLRTVLRSIVHNCFVCRRQRALHSQPRMADLPATRFSATPVAFRTVGVDFFGPFPVHQGRKIDKRYVCLFTCFVVRAVHLEVCSDLSTESCLLALRRFVARRGRPDVLHSDNGTNFQGAWRDIQRNRRAAMENLTNAAASIDIKWQFNPPSAPHFGGIWERLVGIAKRLLFSIAGSQQLNSESFVTFICEIESTLNDRPLTTVSSCLTDPESLTPSHFLIGRSNANPVEVSRMFASASSSRRVYGQVREVLQQFWDRLMKEFVVSLRERTKWHNSVDLLAVGDLVWILEPNTPRGIWPLARVVEVFPGDDNTVRSCRLRTSYGTIVKPAVKLCPVLDRVTSHQ